MSEKNLVPAPAVEARRVVADLVQDGLHLKRGRERLDQECGAERRAVEAQLVLGEREQPVPPPGLEVVLDLGDVVRRRLPPRHERPRRVARDEGEVEEPGRDRLAVYAHVGLVEVKAPDADHQERHVGRVERVRLHDRPRPRRS